MARDGLPLIHQCFHQAASHAAKTGGSTCEEVVPQSSAQVETLVVPRYYPRLAGFRPGDSEQAVELDATKRRRRNAPLSVRMSERQKESVRRKAKAAGISVNRFVVATALGTDYRPPSDPALVRALLTLARELSSQGNNLNQIAHHLNAGLLSAGQGLNALTTLSEVLQKTYRLIQQVLAAGKGEGA